MCEKNVQIRVNRANFSRKWHFYQEPLEADTARRSEDLLFGSLNLSPKQLRNAEEEGIVHFGYSRYFFQGGGIWFSNMTKISTDSFLKSSAINSCIFFSGKGQKVVILSKNLSKHVRFIKNEIRI